MKQTFTAIIWQEDEWFVAQCLEVDIASQGKSEAEALVNLGEALELHFESPQVRRGLMKVIARISPVNKFTV